MQFSVRKMATNRRKMGKFSGLPDRELPLRWRQLVTLVLALGLTACGRSVVSDRIGEQARAPGVVDMTKAADFSWTQVRIYTPYSSRETVCKDLGKFAPGCLEKAPAGVPEGEYLLVFVDEGKEVRYIPHHRRNGNLLPSTGVLVLQRDAPMLDVLPSKSPYQGSALYLQARSPVRL